MLRFTALPRPVLLALAALFSAATIAYSFVWMYYVRQVSPAHQAYAERIARELVMSFPVLFVVVATPVLLLRPRDRHAWLLSVLFAGIIAGAPLTDFEAVIPNGLRRFALAYAFVFSGLLPAIPYYFFAVFPASSPLDRRWPRLKGLLLAMAAMAAVALGAWVSLAGSSGPAREWLAGLAGEWGRPVLISLFPAGFTLGLVSLVLNATRHPSSEVRRKSRVILWGMAAGVTPFALLLGSSAFTGQEYYELPYWMWMPAVLALFLVPLSFAYAVLKHRVLEIPALLKRSARYFLARGFFAVVMTGIAVWVPVRFADVTAETLNFPSDAVAPFALLLGVAFGMLWVAGAGEVEKRIMPRIDRAFFRSVYDARQILEELAHRARTVASRGELALLLRDQIHQALHPKSFAIYFEQGEETLQLQEPAENLPKLLHAKEPLLKELASHGRPWEVPTAGDSFPPRSPLAVNLPHLANLRALLEEQQGRAAPREPCDVLSALAPAAPECLVPLVGRDNRLLGLIVLGERRSEEPYSDEDVRLLASVAGQAAVALENFRLAESMAEKLEGERRAAAEISIAREVQSRLFPQTHPPMATIEYTGLCDQARKVGGDYFDFLDLGPGRIGLALADISGKGIYAALLMANLQANLRSQYARAQDDLPGLMRSVNRLFHQSTSSGLYATMFFADYSDAARRLRYVNCGHNPPLIIRPDATRQRLEPTATVIGLMDPWDCEVGEAELRPGDLLVIYSDGVTEAQSDAGEFFGEERLVEAVRRHAHLPLAEAGRAIAQTVHAFSQSTQDDDLTLLVARAK